MSNTNDILHDMARQSQIAPRIAAWVEALNDLAQAKHAERVAKLVASFQHLDDPSVVVRDMVADSFTIERLTKYVKIVQATPGQRFVHAFVDPNTGDVYKAAGWKAPAKGVRFNLLDDASFTRMLSVLDTSGGYLYIT
jgi:hypothetical protein